MMIRRTVIAVALGLGACSGDDINTTDAEIGADPIDAGVDLDGTDGSDVDVDSDLEVDEDLDVDVVPDGPDVDADPEGWEPSEVAVPGACAALDPGPLGDGSLVERALRCADLCADSDCVRRCVGSEAISAPCTECVVRSTECHIYRCAGCAGPDGEDTVCRDCFASECEADWLVCAGVLAPEQPPVQPPGPGCDVDDHPALSNGDAALAFDECRGECPATSGRFDCTADCVSRHAAVAPLCAACLAEWGRCLDAADCPSCVPDPNGAECIRCSPPACRTELEDCTDGRLSLDLDPARPASIRLINATEVPGMALVDRYTGAPYARRVPPFLVSSRATLEVGIHDLATTLGAVGSSAVHVAEVTLAAGAEDAWAVLGTADAAVSIPELPREPGIRDVRVVNATDAELLVGVGGNAPAVVAPLGVTEVVSLGLGAFEVFVADAGDALSMTGVVDEFGPSFSAILVVHSNADAPFNSSILVLESEGEFFPVELAITE